MKKQSREAEVVNPGKPETEVTKGELAELSQEISVLRSQVAATRQALEELEHSNSEITYSYKRAAARVDALLFSLVLAQEYAKKHQDENWRLRKILQSQKLGDQVRLAV